MAADLDILDIPEAAKVLRLNEQTVRRLARERRLPAFKVGAEWRFHRLVLDRWCQQQCHVDLPGTPRRVLVVDDDEAIRDQLSRLLAIKGCDPATSPNGSAALQKIERFGAPDMVIVDLNMPVMDGPDFLAVVRSRWPQLPVAVLTGYPDSELMARALAHSPVMVLSKPFETKQIEEMLQQVLGQVFAVFGSSAA